MALIKCIDCNNDISTDAKCCIHCGCLNGKPDTDDLTGVKYFYDSYFHEADKISHRTDWFLIFHAILFEAFFAAGGKEIKNIEIQIIIDLLGVVISFYWSMSGIRAWSVLWQFGGYMKDKTKVGEDLAKMHSLIFTDRKNVNSKFYGWAKPSVTFSIILPILFLISWIAVAFIFIDKGTLEKMSGWFIYPIIFVVFIHFIVHAVEKRKTKKVGV